MNKTKVDQKINEIIKLAKENEIEIALIKINKLISKEKGNFFLLNLKGSLLISIKKNNEAIRILNQSIKINSDFPESYNNLGVANLNNGSYSNAISNFKKAIDINPSFEQAYYNLSNALSLSGDYFSALEVIEKLLLINNLNSHAYNLKADIFNQLGRGEDALSFHKKALEINNTSRNFYLVGMDYLYLGNEDTALDYFKKSLSASVDCYCIFAMCNHTDFLFNDDDVLKITNYFELLKNIEDKILIGFSLAKIHEKKQNYTESFHYLKLANDLKNSQLNFNKNTFEQKLSDIKKCYLKLKNLKLNIPCSDKKPIFIAGLPRSGTTLTEQIVTLAPDIYAGGEINFLNKLLSELVDSESVTQEKVLSIRDCYFTYIEKISKSKKFTDKTPTNFLYLGLINIIFPESSFISVKRNYFSVAFSLYQTLFDMNAVDFSYNPENIHCYLSGYDSIISFWENCDQINSLILKYEALIDNHEHSKLELFKFLELEVKEKNLDHTINRNPIYTASVSQARKKIYKSSLKKWKKYGDCIKEFEELIGSI